MDKHDLTEQLHFLIKCLETEMPEYAGYALPDDPKQAFDLYRALCNVRMPSGNTGHTLPDDFYTVQSEVLKSTTEEKGITEAADLPPARLDERLFLWQGDITTLRADAIVNAANSQMLGCFSPLHGCIDNIIHTMAGVELRETCCQIMKAQGHEEPTGSAKITPGYLQEYIARLDACRLESHHKINVINMLTLRNRHAILQSRDEINNVSSKCNRLSIID